MHRSVHPLLLCCLLCVPWSLPAAAASESATESAASPVDREVVVGIHESPPFVMPGDNQRWTGLAIELWELMADEAGLAYRYQPMQLDAMLKALESGDIDLAVGAISMTAEREKLMDLTHPYLVSGFGIAVPERQGSDILAVLGGLMSTNLLKVLGVVAGWLLLSGFLVWLFEHRRNPAMFGGPPRKGIGSGFWWALVTLTTVGYGDKSPITIGGRIVATLWMIIALVILSSLTAAITSSMTVNSLNTDIRGPGDLVGKRVASVTGSASAEWLQGRGVRVDGYDKLDQALIAVREGHADAAVYDAPILNHLLQQRNMTDLHLLDGRFHPHFYGFALPQGSEHREKVNYHILRHINSDAFTRLRQAFLGHEE